MSPSAALLAAAAAVAAAAAIDAATTPRSSPAVPRDTTQPEQQSNSGGCNTADCLQNPLGKTEAIPHGARTRLTPNSLPADTTCPREGGLLDGARPPLFLDTARNRRTRRCPAATPQRRDGGGREVRVRDSTAAPHLLLGWGGLHRKYLLRYTGKGDWRPLAVPEAVGERGRGVLWSRAAAVALRSGRGQDGRPKRGFCAPGAAPGRGRGRLQRAATGVAPGGNFPFSPSGGGLATPHLQPPRALQPSA
eukprot:212745-Chlamydomonas_euryale.AAC.4